MTDSGITLSFSCSIDFAYILIIGGLDSSKWTFLSLGSAQGSDSPKFLV